MISGFQLDHVVNWLDIVVDSSSTDGVMTSSRLRWMMCLFVFIRFPSSSSFSTFTGRRSSRMYNTMLLLLTLLDRFWTANSRSSVSTRGFWLYTVLSLSIYNELPFPRPTPDHSPFIGNIQTWMEKRASFPPKKYTSRWELIITARNMLERIKLLRADVCGWGKVIFNHPDEVQVFFFENFLCFYSFLGGFKFLHLSRVQTSVSIYTVCEQFT